MEIRRFGPGHRRPDGPPGTQGVTGQVIHDDGAALVSELAFGRYAMITPHSNPNAALFIVISGGGYVQVGDERARVNHGEAVLWPPGVAHGAYTDGIEMRAIVVEMVAPTDDAMVVLDGRARALQAAAAASEAPVDTDLDTEERAARSTAPQPTRGEGTLAERPRLRDEYDTTEGEPW
ncbi:MAG TPA: cupin domain-containing protein [Candidatus Caenarcaniphilales bacterium]|nr:cupin domain-containing protein [Candidatus Caenarcaniphilales bacterium]